MVVITLKRGEEKRILLGDPWIYDNEIAKWKGEYEPGDIVEVQDSHGRFIGRGYVNPHSKIRVRLMTRKREEVNGAMVKKRIQNAWDYRQLVADPQACRVVFTEADLLPGLIVDKFGDYLCIQTMSLGIEKFRDDIISALHEIIHPKGIYERNDVKVRELEGLTQQTGFIGPEFDTEVAIEENGLKMVIDIAGGQKTGYFLDQRENRAAIAPYVKDAYVLDAFTHTGSFALHAAKYGAKRVKAVDISEHAIEYVMKNAVLNGFGGMIEGECANVFDYLREYNPEEGLFDTIILDPPAFCKNRSAITAAYRGYKEINLRAMKLLKPGGFLITCSCSHYMKPDMFNNMLMDAAMDAHRTVRQIEYRQQAKDHPVLLGFDESLYLKCFILQVL